MTVSRNLFVSACVGVFAIGVVPPPAAADPIADFYKGKRLQMFSGSEPGGGYDTYARLLARHIVRHIPGKPRIVVQNMPGAGGVVAANFVYNVAAQDGTVIGSIQRAVPFVPIFGRPGPKYEPEKFHWLGSLNNEVGVVTVWNHTTKVRSLQDAMQQEVLVAGTGPNDTEIYPALLNNTLGTRFKIIAGYPSTSAADLAIERGEVMGVSASFSSMVARNPDWREKTSVLVQLSTVPHPDLSKKGVPMVLDLLKDKGEEVTTIWRLMLTQKAMGRPFMMGPRVPADRVAAMRKALADTVKDKVFMAEADKQKREVEFVSGEDIQEMIVRVAAAPKGIIAKMEAYTSYKGEKGKARVELARHTGKVTATPNDARQIVIQHEGKDVMAKVSGSRTKITVGGKPAKRDAVKVGMTCTFTYPAPGEEANNVDCK
jgi:tripartite-type tricarboxylate transporter receptor subunit TctC